MVEATDLDLHANVLVSIDQGVSIIADGISHRVYVNSDKPIETRAFSYLPPSSKFQFVVSSKSFSFGVPYSVYLKKINQRDLANYTTSSLNNRRILSTSTNWMDSMIEKGDFDYSTTTASGGNSSINMLDLFKVFSITMEEDQDALLVLT